MRHERNVMKIAATGEEHDRRRESPLVIERDTVVGLADLEAAVVVGGHAAWKLRVDDFVNLLDDAGTDAVDAALVEGHNQRRHRRIVGHQVAADEIVTECPLTNVSGARSLVVVEELPNVKTTVACRFDNRRRGQAGDAVHRVDALDISRHVLDEGERGWREQAIR